MIQQKVAVFYLSALLAISQLPLSQCLFFHCRYARTCQLVGWFCCNARRIASTYIFPVICSL